MTRGDAPRGESVLVSLGSNIEPTVNLERALEIVAANADVQAVSSVFATDPVGGESMPSFLNAALELRTELEPAVLKYEILRPIESRLGRQRTDDRNAPRTIDLDVALFGDRTIVDHELQLEIPDADILKHAHVAFPLADIAPARRHPTTGRTLADIAAGFGSDCGVQVAPRGAALKEKLARIKSE
ncbi:MAG: 2-amino-4-hydroxy-6-hydroxymethyldihydropteridine diphosphokinase [Acidobacteriota bacterium]|nr:2-amino-4-hydroxy-6-hydroxymethyldihydropteridine diphosphokinase [Acidobacteriota bacterium]